jgi:hypothetical protein
MPPCLDIYVVAERTRSVIDRFLDTYVDRRASENRGDEELMLLPLDAEPGEPHGWDWEPAKTLTAAIERGLTVPWRAFAIYLKSKHPSHDGACLAFTPDGRVVLGVSIDDPNESDEKITLANELLAELTTVFSAERGFIGVEEPPPLSGTLSDDGRWLVRWHRDST